MKTRHLIPAYVAIALLFLRADCNFVSFDQKPLALTVNIDKIFHMQSASGTDTKSAVVNMAQLYLDAGVDDPTKISDVTTELISITILENNTGASTTASGNLQFQESLPGATIYPLANFTNLNLNSVLNAPITPFGTGAALGVNLLSVNALTTAIKKIPPTTLTLYFTGSAANGPIDFKAHVVCKLQAKYAP